MRDQTGTTTARARPSGGAAAGEDHALGDHLTDQTTASGAERGANGHLLLAG